MKYKSQEYWLVELIHYEVHGGGYAGGSAIVEDKEGNQYCCEVGLNWEGDWEVDEILFFTDEDGNEVEEPVKLKLEEKV